MPLNEYIINDLNPFEVDATISELQEVFNQLTYSHVPIQKDGVFWGACQKLIYIVSILI